MSNTAADQITRLVRRVVAPLQRRVRLMVARAVIELVDDGKKCQTLQVSVFDDEVRDDTERFGEYGFTSVPQVGAEALILRVSGNSDHGVVVATEDRRYRPTGLQEGEVALYTVIKGIRVRCRENGLLDLGTEPTDYVALASLVKEELGALRDTVDAAVSTFNGHNHTGTFSGTIGGATASGTLTTTAPTSPASAPAAVGDVAATEVRAK